MNIRPSYSPSLQATNTLLTITSGMHQYTANHHFTLGNATLLTITLGTTTLLTIILGTTTLLTMTLL